MAPKQLEQYTSAQITRALVELAAHGGDAAAASESLVDDEFMVPAATLRRWKRETHAEQYRRIEEEQGRELERIAAEQARATIVRAGQIERDLLEDMKHVPAEQKPQALRAVADTKSKNVDKLLALTGRTAPPARPNEFATLLEAMQAKGLIRLVAPVAVPNEAEPAVDGSASEEEPAS